MHCDQAADDEGDDAPLRGDDAVHCCYGIVSKRASPEACDDAPRPAGKCRETTNGTQPDVIILSPTVAVPRGVRLELYTAVQDSPPLPPVAISPHVSVAGSFRDAGCMANVRTTIRTVDAPCGG
jgi:hypothetical protein